MRLSRAARWESVRGELRGGHVFGLVLAIEFGTGYSNVGHYMTFKAEERGVVQDVSAPSDLLGCEWRRQLAAGPTFYANELRSHTRLHPYAQIIEQIATGGVVHEAADTWVAELVDRFVVNGGSAARAWLRDSYEAAEIPMASRAA